MAIHASAAVEHPHSVPSEPVTDRRPHGRKGSGLVKFLVIVAVLVAIGGGTYKVLGKEKSMQVVHYVKEHVGGGSDVVVEPDAPARPKSYVTGQVSVNEEEWKSVGIRIKEVEDLKKPIELEINGTTDYDQNSLHKIRPRFDNALVEEVKVSAGQEVTKGQALLVLRSHELGQAKNECRTNFVQWDHDHKYLMAREPLAKDGRITQIVWTDTVTNEKSSRLSYFVSREKLATYGMTVEQIDKLLEGLGDDPIKIHEANKKAEDITRMTVVSPIDGIVVERDAVPDNFYDQTNIMLTISPMSELWVWGNVFESDQDKVHIKDKLRVELQFTKEQFDAEVQSIANGVDPDTRTLRIRASIGNQGKNLKARMLVKAYLKIPPREGETCIPRNALSVINGKYYAFVWKGVQGEDGRMIEGRKPEIEPGNADKVVAKAGLKDKKERAVFERRDLEVDQERSDEVVVKSGLKSNEWVVTNGSLILSQMLEDQETVTTGLPAQ